MKLCSAVSVIELIYRSEKWAMLKDSGELIETHEIKILLCKLGGKIMKHLILVWHAFQYYT